MTQANLPSLAALRIGPKYVTPRAPRASPYDRVQELSPDERAWLSLNWKTGKWRENITDADDLPFDSAGEEIEWENILPDSPGWANLQVAKLLARDAVSGGWRAPTEPTPSPVALYSSANYRVRARALLRFWFNKGDRHWDYRWDTSGNVTAALYIARLQWAETQTKDWTTENILEKIMQIPVPPPNLWVIGYDEPPNVAAVMRYGRPMPKFENEEMPRYVGNQGMGGGMEILCFVKMKQLAHVVEVRHFDALPDPFDYIDTVVKQNEEKLMKVTYANYMLSLKEWGVDFSRNSGPNNAAWDYTTSSDRFNRLLRLPPANVTAVIPDLAGFQARRLGDKMELIEKFFFSESAKSTEENFEYEEAELKYLHRSLTRIHALWRLLSISPVLPAPVHVIRAVRKRDVLPHVLAGYPIDSLPERGTTFLDCAFVSTSRAPPDVYYDDSTSLSTFFEPTDQCCFLLLTIEAGVPILPLYLADGVSRYDSEKEIILPPLLLFTFEEKKEVQMSSGKPAAHVYSYTVRRGW